MERVFICTSKERLITVLEAVEPYLKSIEGPRDGDPGYLLTCEMPIGMWGNIIQKLRN